MTAIATGIGTAPVAPANGANNGAPKSNGAPAPGQQPAGSDQPGGATAAAKSAEPYRFKKEIVVRGKKIAADLDETGLTRALQERYHFQQEHEAAQPKLKAAAEFEALLRTNPREALKMKGLDYDAMLLAEAERHAAMAEMTPEQKRIAELEHQAKQREESDKQAQAERQKALKEFRKQQVREQTKQTLFAALESCGLPITGKGNEARRGAALAMGVKLQKMALRKTGLELGPAELGAAIQRAFLSDLTSTADLVTQAPEFRTKNAEALAKMLEATTAGLEGEALLKFLGPKMRRRLLAAEHAALDAKPGLTVGGTTTAPAPEEEQTLDYYAATKRRVF